MPKSRSKTKNTTKEIDYGDFDDGMANTTLMPFIDIVLVGLGIYIYFAMDTFVPLVFALVWALGDLFFSIKNRHKGGETDNQYFFVLFLGPIAAFIAWRIEVGLKDKDKKQN